MDNQALLKRVDREIKMVKQDYAEEPDYLEGLLDALATVREWLTDEKSTYHQTH